jgi:hypothetical protein
MSTTPPPPVFLAANIDSVLLTPSEITDITGGKFKGYPSGPVEVISSSLGPSDNTHAIDPRGCAGVIFGAEQQVYANTRYEAIRTGPPERQAVHVALMPADRLADGLLVEKLCDQL